MTPRAIVTDIEGTTSSIAFVHDVLFPYARARLAAFVMENAEAVGVELAQVRRETGQLSLSIEECIAKLLAWHDADRKIAPLKTIQGMIWDEGYVDGTLVSHVYADAVAGLRRWHALGIPLYVYSSGSVAAQKLLFAHTHAGDLTPLFSGYVDTGIGGKRESGSYREIARQIGTAAGEILFLSDVEAELAAAREAGFSVMLIVRDEQPNVGGFPSADSFDTILPERATA